jgi:hypothetical protein
MKFPGSPGAANLSTELFHSDALTLFQIIEEADQTDSQKDAWLHHKRLCHLLVSFISQLTSRLALGVDVPIQTLPPLKNVLLHAPICTVLL